MQVTDVGLVLEGGAMRGMFTSGVLDVWMERDLWIQDCVGISAGAVFGCNYKSRQIGRSVRYNKRFCRNKDYASFRSWLFTGDIYGADFGYRRIPFELDIFDNDAFKANPMDFHVGATNLITGKCDFHSLSDGGEEDLLWLRASASMPLVSRIVEIGGVPYLDGGVADSIPLDYMEDVRGHRRNVVVLTQPEGFVKQPNSMLPLMKLRYGRRYPAFVASLADRHNAYNARLEEIRAREREGLCFVIRPPQALEIKAVVHDPDELERVYQIGRRTGESTFEALTTFLRSQPLL